MLPNSFAVLWTAACHVALHRQSRHIVNSCLIFSLFSRLRAVVSVSAQALLTAETGFNRDSMVRLLFSDKYLFLLSSCASELDLNMSDVENNHAHCKHNSPEGTSAELMCAKHVLREVRVVAVAACCCGCCCCYICHGCCCKCCCCFCFCWDIPRRAPCMQLTPAASNRTAKARMMTQLPMVLAGGTQF